MSERTLERQPTIEHVFADEQKALREIQLIRDQRDMEGLNERVLQFEESGEIKIVSYNDYQKETLSRGTDGQERVSLEDITIDEKAELDSIHDFIDQYEQYDMGIDDGILGIEFDDEKEFEDVFGRDEREDNERENDMEYDS